MTHPGWHAGMAEKAAGALTQLRLVKPAGIV